jgi:hypothetical protein
MYYQLVTARGQTMHFVILSCAELFQQLYGGKITAIDAEIEQKSIRLLV